MPNEALRLALLLDKWVGTHLEVTSLTAKLTTSLDVNGATESNIFLSNMFPLLATLSLGVNRPLIKMYSLAC